MTNLIIDSHSHIGIGFNNRVATTLEYQSIREKLGINISLLMPQPILDNRRNQSQIDIINSELFKEIETGILKDTAFFIPVVSPIFTSPEILEKYIELYQPLAFKIHLKNDYSYPEIIPQCFTRIIKKHNIPLIVHTDFSDKNISEKDKLKNLNSALSWFKYFKENEIKGYLTHGARLNPYVLESINFTENIGIGIGPDVLLEEYPSSLEQQGRVLDILYNYVNPDRLFFDLDYNWNLTKQNNLELGSINRVKSIWNEDDQRLILGENSNEFFGITKRLENKNRS